MAIIPGWSGEVTGSTSGSLADGVDVTITFNERSFFPSIRSDAGDTWIRTNTATGQASGTTGRMWLWQQGATANYDVDWRYVSLSAGTIPGWRGELTGSASGSLGAGAGANLEMNERTFFPNIRMVPGTPAPEEMAIEAHTAGANNTVGRLRPRAGDTENANYDIRWGYIQV